MLNTPTQMQGRVYLLGVPLRLQKYIQYDTVLPIQNLEPVTLGEEKIDQSTTRFLEKERKLHAKYRKYRFIFHIKFTAQCSNLCSRKFL